MERLQESVKEAPIIDKDGYAYLIHPVSNCVPALDPELLREIVVRIIRKAELENVDKIVTPEAMGIHLSTAVSLMTDIPLVVIRKREYGLEGETPLFQQTGYSENQMYINDVEAGDGVLVLDDVVSTGGTLTAVCGALEEIGADLVDVVAVIKKVGGENRLAESPYSAKTLINVDVVDGEVVVTDPEGDG